ncbi:MAG: tetratricopeptide repeat protein, partial [bacterium]
TDVLDLRSHRQIFDYGFISENLVSGKKDQLDSLEESDSDIEDRYIFTISEWLEFKYSSTPNFFKRKHLSREIALKQDELIRIKSNLERAKENRYNFIVNSIDAVLRARKVYTSELCNKFVERFDRINIIDSLYYDIACIQSEISLGKFLNIDKKREFIDKKKRFDKQRRQFENTISELRARTDIKRIFVLNEEVNRYIDTVVALESGIIQLKNELQYIMEKSLALSPLEVQKRLMDVLENLKKIGTACSRKMDVRSQFVYTGKQKPVTKKEVQKLLYYVKEYDPEIFNNSRVKYMGIPKFIIIPANGGALYDWKTNCVFIPAISDIPLEEYFIVSMAEFRLDADRENLLITGYKGAAGYSDSEPAAKIKKDFLKDYTDYMCSETKGIHKMKKNILQWFIGEIAPKNDNVKMSLKYDPCLMSLEESESINTLLVQKCEQGTATAEENYGLGILYFCKGKFEKAAEVFAKAAEMDPDYADAYYNLGIANMKASRKEESIKGFSTFVSICPPGLWFDFSQEHLKRLKAS